MSRTYRRRAQRHEYRWVLREWHWSGGALAPHQIDPRSKEGRRAIARFHSDVERTVSSGPPRWYRRVHDHRLRTQNLKEFRRWLDDPDYDPVLQVRHRHSAKWSWW